MSYLDFDFPHTRFFESDLRELIKQVFIMNDLVTNFVSINAIKYANPIQWNITKSYEKNTVVIDGNSGVAYISVRPVPAGVALTREQYWTKVFDLSVFITKGASNFARSYEEQPTTTATMSTDEGEWVVWDTTLYKALTNIHPGDRYVVDGNIRRMTVEDFYDALKSIIDNEVHEREAGDDALELALNEETEIRGEADSTLHQEIVQESVDRENADNALGDRIDNEALAREQADTALGGRIDNEALAREQADTALGERIAAVSSSTMKTIFDYGYQSGENITQYVQAFINDDSASQLYLHMNGEYVIDSIDFTPISGAIDRIKHFTKSANTRLSGEGATQIGIGTGNAESAEINAKYSTGSDGYATRFIRNSNVVHTPNGNTQINAMFIDNVINPNDGYYHWNILGQSNIYSNTTGEDCVCYLQAHVYGDNENWALATENILHGNNETHNTRGIEVALTGAGDVSPNGGKRIGIHIVNNTTGGGFNADYGIFFSSHANGTGFKRLIQIANGFSDYILHAEPNYTCVYGIDLAQCNVNGAAVRVGKNGGHCIQFDEFVTVEENQLGVEVLALKHGANNLGITMNTSTNASNIIKFLDVIYNGETYKIPMYQ